MKSLCLLITCLGQFQLEELKPISQVQAFLFLQEELTVTSLPEKKTNDTVPTFDFLTADWCGGCSGVKKTLGVDSRGVSTKSGLFIVRTWNVDSRGWLGASSIPAFSYNGRVFQYGYSTPENLMENFRKVSARQAKTVQRLTTVQLKEFARTYSGQAYDVSDGDYWSHLQNGITHKFTGWQLNDLTQAECAKIHAGDHYGYLTPFSIGGK